MTLLADLVETSAAVAGMPGRRDKIGALSGFLSAVSENEITLAVSYLIGEFPQGRTGIGVAALRRAMPPETAGEATLTLHDVDASFSLIAAISGAGSQAARQECLTSLLERATASEVEFIWKLVLGDLRQGALEGVMVEAIARTTGTPTKRVRRAHMLGGDLAAVAAAAREGGAAALDAFRLEIFRPVLPMLAKTASDPGSALDQFGTAVLEWKIDGARIQVHKHGQHVRVFTRTLKDITDRLPEIVDAVAGFPTESCILDGEAIALDDAERPRPFQESMGRFATAVDAATGAVAVELTPFFFDCLLLDGEDLLDRSGAERNVALDAAVPDRCRVPRLVTSDVSEADRFFANAIAAGHEGIMVKSLEVPYEAGRRGAGWLKVKPVHTLDLVVLAVEWGSGRRRGKLSNIHLGARDPASGGFVMLGKTFKGMTDEMLRWQTERFLELETHREGHVVYVRPEQVVEIAFDGIQASPRYPGGMTLRFARVKGYREDKTADDADTIGTVRAMFAGETG
jgi:DNA ligase-1